MRSLSKLALAILPFLCGTSLHAMWDRPALQCTWNKSCELPPRLPESTPHETSLHHIEGTKIWCKTIGKGDPLVVVHGGPGLSHDYLMPHMESLARNRQVIFYDQRGCGRSEGCEAPDEITVDRYVKDIEEIRKAYGHRRVSILGHSWGGYVAMKYAIAHPGNVEKMILVNSLPATSEGYAAFSDEYQRRMAPFHDKLVAITDSPEFAAGDPSATEEYNRIVFRSFMKDGEKADLLNLRMSPEATTNGRAVSQAFVEDIFSQPYDLRSELRTLNIPTLVVHGDVDPVPAYVAEETYKSIPGAKFVLISNTGHFPYIESPSIFFETVDKFLE